MAETRNDLLKQIEKIVRKLNKLGWDEVCRVNEFNVHTYKMYELRGFISFYERELENQIAKWKREKYWATEEGKLIKEKLEIELQTLSDNFDKFSENTSSQIDDLIKPHFDNLENWTYKIYKERIIFSFTDVYKFSIHYMKNYSKQEKLNVSLDEFREFNLLNETSKIPSILNVVNNFLNNVDKENLIKLFSDWNTEFKKFNKRYKELSYKLFNPDF